MNPARTIWFLIPVLALALAIPPAVGAPKRTKTPARTKTYVQGGFVSGQAYLDMPNLRKLAYVGGLLEGMFLAPRLGGDAERLKWLAACVDPLGRRGVRDLLARDLLAKDATWNNRNPAKMYRAIRAGCGKGLKPQAAKPETRRDGGYITGQEYLDMDGLAKRAYVGGLVEGVFLTVAFGVRTETLRPFVACIDRLGWPGVRKAINKRLLAESSLWGKTDPEPRFRAIEAFCRAMTTPKEGAPRR